MGIMVYCIITTSLLSSVQSVELQFYSFVSTEAVLSMIQPHTFELSRSFTNNESPCGYPRSGHAIIFDFNAFSIS